MRSRQWIWISLCLLLAAGAWFFRPQGQHPASNARTKPSALTTAAGPIVAQTRPLTILSTNSPQAMAAAARTNHFAMRLSNTTRTIGELMNDRHAILLENAFIDTDIKFNLSIPKQLRASGDPGAYIVQASGPINPAFRAMLSASGAQIVSYIPNNAYLVRAPAGAANGLAGKPMTQAVIPYEPYYKISSSMPVTIERETSAWTPIKAPRTAKTSLLALAVAQKPLPAGTYLTLGLFNDGAAATVAQIEKLGGRIVARDHSPFGPVVRVQPPADWVALAALPGVQLVEPSMTRTTANDLSRATVGVAADTLTTINYMNLSGSNVVVQVNDSGIDATHPDFSGGGTTPVRVIGDPANLVDTDGHGTHVAGIIAGDGTESATVTNAQGSIMPGTNGQFRGMAPGAKLFSMNMDDPDPILQEAAAFTNALISNNSWNYGDSDYDLAAASYDAAVRDALPLVTGSQPVLFVFSAGNDGNGDDTTDRGGTSDSIDSPGTAKNVITVGAIQEYRDITNEVTNADGTISAPWQADTSTDYRIAGFSSRGNVGIGTEGTFGRYKPDVVAPGTSIISTRSSQWDIGTYFYQSPTNYNLQDFSAVIPADSLGAGQFPTVPTNTVQVTIQLFPNALSPDHFPFLPIYFGLVSSPVYTDVTTNNLVSIPPDGGLTIADILSSGEGLVGFNFAISNITSEPIDFDVELDTVTTNNPGNYFLVYSNLDQTLGSPNPASTGPGPYYRYETGTSMAAADASGVLALMQDYFTNTLHTVPSPALLKALLINGARTTGSYDLQVQNNINYEGWGLVNLPNSVPPGVTNQINMPCSEYFLDQSPTNALATGDSHTFMVTVNTNGNGLPLRVTLAWTDPPGDPAAAIKLVNNLDLVVTNLDDPTHPVIFYGNDIGSGSIFNTPEGTNAPANLDAINNVENVFISLPLGTNYSITVIGRDVNVNAVTAQTNTLVSGIPTYAPNVVQDYALVVSCGEGEVTNAMTVTDGGGFSNPTTDQQVTFLGATNSPLLNQFVGASTPLMGTNNVPIGTITVLDTNGVSVGIVPGLATNAVVTAGMTNQWHFYVITNPVSGAADVTNAGFITFLPDTLSIPRMGVFADSTAEATTPEADIDLYVTTDSNLLTLSPIAISNCVHGTQVGLSVAGVFNGASLSRGGTEFVADIGSKPSQIYYIGVKSERQVAAEYDFLPIFTSTPFSQMNPNGTQTVNGQLLPVNIPDGSPAHPGIAYIFGLAIFPMEVNQVVVNDSIVHNNYGDLIGTLNHNDIRDVLNNHDSLDNPPGPYTFEYDDSGSGDYPGSRPSDGPGSLQDFTGTQGIGPWMLAEKDTAPTQTGSNTAFNLTITPHQDLSKGINVLVQPGTWFYDYIDVPVGYINLTVSATNTPPTVQPPVELFVKPGTLPTAADTNDEVLLTNCVAGTYPTGSLPGNSISTGPPLTPGRYFVGIFNPSLTPANVHIIASLGFSPSAISTVNYASGGPAPILDDAVTDYTINVTNTDLIQDFNVGLRVDHPRISDLVFHLISPDGTRYLLMENRGGTSTNGCGATIISSNSFAPQSFSGGAVAVTNVIDTGVNSGSVAINYDFFALPDEMTVYYNSARIFDSGFASNSGTFYIQYGPGPSTDLTIIMNQFGNTNSTTAWSYTVASFQTNYVYLAFTEDTNLTTTPIKFAPPPFVPPLVLATNPGTLMTSLVVPGASNPWLAGMPNGSTVGASCGNTDTAPGQSPVQVTGLPLTAGDPLTFSASGTVSYGPPAPYFGPDGDPNVTIRNPTPDFAPANGLPECRAPYDSLVGVFLDATQPDSSPVPTALDFSTQASQDYAQIAPALKQVFFIGDGLTSAGLVQHVVVPPGATRLFLGTIDGCGWANNAGFFNVSVTEPTIVTNLTSLSSNLYYLPEESIEALNNQSAFGPWTLEVQDDRAGAANGVLQSWDLGFTFANTNYTPPLPILIGGQPQTNTVCSNSIDWYQVNVPLNATAATNLLLFATAPVNVWYSANNPPTTNNPGDMVLITNATSGSYILTPTTTPALVPGGTYYLGVQDTSGSCTTYAIEVDFQFVGQAYAFTEPAKLVTGTNALLDGFATPNGYPSTAWFQWGPNTLYGNVTAPVNVGLGNSVVYTTNEISGLVTNVAYHFRLVVSNSVGVIYGFDQILDEANVVAWGANYLGQISPPTNAINVTAIAGAYDHSLALTTNATVLAWGDNAFGQSTVPANVTNAVAVGGGQYSSVALKSDGTITNWGGNTLSQLNAPTNLNNVVEIAGGTYSSLALKNDGTIAAWGTSFFNLTNVPAGATNIVAVSCGGYHNMALRNDGAVIAWGEDGAGQTNVPPSATNVVAIAAGGFHSVALRKDGTVVVWGDDSANQTNMPASATNVVAIAAGGFHSLALKNGGTVVAWGDDSAGQLNVPTGLTNMVAIAAGYLHSLALTPQVLINPTNITVLPLTPGVAQTNSILGDSITYYTVNVPANADYSTNTLLFALNGLLNVWYCTNTPLNLSATNATLLFGNATNGVAILGTNGTPAFVPGSTYYLGVQNTNSFVVNYAVEVDFHLLTVTAPPATNTVPISGIIATNIGGTNGFLLIWYAPTNDEFLVHWTDSLTPPVAWGVFSNVVSYASLTPTNGIGFFEFFDDGSQTGGFGPMRFYRLELLLSPTNGVPQPDTVPAGGIDYFLINVPAAADFATNRLFSATGPLNLLFNQAAPPTGTNAGDYTLLAGVTNGGSVLSATSAPTNIVPGGTCWLGVQNTNSFAVSFSLEVDFHLVAATNAIVISSITSTNIGGTNGFLLIWSAPTNDVFQVQWTGVLSPVNWQFFTNFISYTGPVVPANGWFSFLDDGSQTPPGLPPARFYRIVLAGSDPSTRTNAVLISSLVSTNLAGTNVFWLAWSAPTNYLFELQWTTNLAPVVTWQTAPNIVAYSTFVSPTNSLFDFLDDGSQGGLGPEKFYRLLVLP